VADDKVAIDVDEAARPDVEERLSDALGSETPGSNPIPRSPHILQFDNPSSGWSG
jgi:hypothetical protein